MIRVFAYDDYYEFDDNQQVKAWMDMFPSLFGHDEKNLRIENHEQAGTNSPPTE